MKFRAIQICLVIIVAAASAGVRGASRGDDHPSQKAERSIASDPSVTVSICVMAGSVNVHGWDKNEVMARSSDAAEIELRQREATPQPGKALKVELFVIDKSGDQRIKSNCQSYSDLEVFVPRAGSVHVQTRDGNINISDIAVAIAGTQNGDIIIEGVSHAVEVGSVGGGVSIKDSTGRASITTIGGGIEVMNLRPAGAADGFEAVSVSGDLILEGVSHSNLNARTVTGEICLTGPLASGGRYGFKTMSGDITLTLPSDSAFNLSAKVSQNGEIISDFPLTLLPDAAPPTPPATPVVSNKPPQSPAPAVTPQASPVVVKVAPRINKVIVTTPTITVTAPTLRRVNAVHGSGGANIQVASFSGTLHLLKN